MSTNGNGRSQWVWNAILGILLGLIAVIWRSQVDDVKEAKQVAREASVASATLKASTDAKLDELLRRMTRIEDKLDGNHR